MLKILYFLHLLYLCGFRQVSRLWTISMILLESEKKLLRKISIPES